MSDESNKDVWDEFWKSSKQLQDFASESDSIENFGENIQIDRDMIGVINALANIDSVTLGKLMPEALIKSEERMSEEMYWITNIAHTVITTMVGMGITIYPHVANNIYIYATFIYISVKGGDQDEVATTEEDPE